MYNIYLYTYQNFVSRNSTGGGGERKVKILYGRPDAVFCSPYGTLMH
jgi:hypothetical protein